MSALPSTPAGRLAFVFDLLTLPSPAQELGARLRARRKALGLRLVDVGRSIRVSGVQVSYYERGLRRPSDRVLPHLLRTLRFSGETAAELIALWMAVPAGAMLTPEQARELLNVPDIGVRS